MKICNHKNLHVLKTLTVIPIEGLKLKQMSQEYPFKAFDYMPAVVYSADMRAVDWYVLSDYNIEGDHIRVHELSKGGNLLECAREYQKSHAQAMIVINTTEDSILSSEMSQPLLELERFLVAILPRTEGRGLLDCLQDQVEDDEIYARYENEKGW